MYFMNLSIINILDSYLILGIFKTYIEFQVKWIVANHIFSINNGHIKCDERTYRYSDYIAHDFDVFTIHDKRKLGLKRGLRFLSI